MTRPTGALPPSHAPGPCHPSSPFRFDGTTCPPLDAVATAVYTTDATGVLTGYNAAAARMWGQAPEPGTARWCGSLRLYRPDGSPLPYSECPMAIALRERRPVRGLEGVLERPDGSRISFLAHPIPLFNRHGDLAGGINTLVDISAYKQVERSLRQRMAEQAALHELTDRLHHAKTLEAAHEAALTAITAAMPCDRAAILLLDDRREMRFVAAKGLSETYRQAADGHSPWSPDETAPRPVFIPDVENCDLGPDLQAAIRQERVRALAFFPLIHAGRLVGKFMAYADHPRELFPLETEIGMAIGRQLGFAVDRIRGEAERARMDQDLRESEARFRSLVSLSSDWFWEQDENFRYTEFSSSVVDLAGSSVASHIGKTRWELPAVGVSEEQWAEHRAALERHEPFRDFEYRRINERGEVIWMTVSGDPVHDAAGRFAGYRGTGRNITFRRRAEEMRRTEEARYRTALKVGRMASWEADFVEQSRTWSPEAIELFGLSLPSGKGFVGSTGDELRQAIHPEDRHRLDRYHELIQTQDEIDASYRIVLPGGSIRHLAGRGQVTARCPDGRPWVLVNIVADVTDRAQAEERSLERARELEAAKAKYQALVEASAQVEWSAAPDGTIVNDSPTWRAFTGQSFDQWRGTGWLDAVHPADRERTEAAWQAAIATGSVYDVDYRVRHVGGKYRWTRARGVPLRDANGSIIEWVGVSEDITDLKQREEHLEVVMWELSHRTKNLLSVIQSIARRTLSAKADSPEVRAFTERLQGLALSHDLLVRGNWHGASLQDLVLTHLGPFGPLNPQTVSVEGPPISVTPAIAQSIGLAIHELATNAAKYGALSTIGGTLKITWSEVESLGQPLFSLTWHETPNSPAQEALVTGFGKTLLQRIAASSVGGTSDYRIDPTGVVWTLTAPLRTRDDAIGGDDSLFNGAPWARGGIPG